MDTTSAPGLVDSSTRGLGTDRSPDLRSMRWALGIWVLVVCFAVVTALWSHHVGVPLRDPGGKMFRGRLTSALSLLAGLAALDALWRAQRSAPGWVPGPRRVLTVLRSRWPWQRVWLAVTGLVAYHCVYVCYRNLKSWDAFNAFRDEQLLRFDKWLLGGHSPALVLHDLLGVDAAAHVLAGVYRSFTYLVPLALVGSLAFSTRIRQGYVFLASAMWVWVLGVASYYLIPTLGPFATAASEFASLPHTAITTSQEGYLAERAHFLADPSAGDAFVSISAFASLHVGYTCMVVLMLRYYGLRRASWLLTAYLGAVMVATVYFGWHFVVDDVAGVLLAALAVLLGRWTVYPTRGRPAP